MTNDPASGHIRRWFCRHYAFRTAPARLCFWHTRPLQTANDRSLCERDARAASLLHCSRTSIIFVLSLLHYVFAHLGFTWHISVFELLVVFRFSSSLATKNISFSFCSSLGRFHARCRSLSNFFRYEPPTNETICRPFVHSGCCRAVVTCHERESVGHAESIGRSI